MSKLTQEQRNTIATLKAARVSRRNVLKGALAAGAVGALSPAFVRNAFSSSGELNFLGWAGYDAFPGIFAEFEAATGIKINFSGMGSQDEMFAAITAQPEGFDISEPTGDRLVNWREGGYIQAWDEAKANVAGIEPAILTGMVGNMMVTDGARYGVPSIWGTETLCYNKDEVQLTDGALSLAALWDEAYTGRVTVRGHSGLAAIGLMLDKQGKLPHSYAESWESEEKMVANYDVILGVALENRAKVAQFWTNENEAQGAFRTNGVVIGHNWDSSAAALMKEGMPIGYIAASEGAFTWMQNFVLLKGAKNSEQAHAWAAWINSAEGGHKWATAYGSNPCAIGAVDLADDFSKAFFTAAYPGDALSKLFWWPSTSGWFVTKRNEYADKFLAA